MHTKARDLSRRQFAKQVLFSAVGAAVLPPAVVGKLKRLPAHGEGERAQTVLVGDSELERIRFNLRQPYFAHIVPILKKRTGSEMLRFLREKVNFANRLWDIPKICEALRSAAVLTATDYADRTNVVLAALDVLHRFPAWDYFVDGNETIGLQRAPESVQSVIFALELMGDRLPSQVKAMAEKDLAEKGCRACYQTLWSMDHPDKVQGWQFAKDAKANFQELDFSHWPLILQKTNLHAVPLAALGLGALYLRGNDSRSQMWLETATRHAHWFCQNVYLPDGSYPEGISYWGYATQELLTFLWALEKNTGLDLFDELNLPGQVDFALALQAGRVEVKSSKHPIAWVRDGKKADIVNFSDAKDSFRMTAMAWIAAKLRDPVAQRAALERAGIWDEYAFLAFDPTVPVKAKWPQYLKNVRLETGWVIWRSGWEDGDTVVAFRSGGPGNHEHADRNTVVVKTRGEWLLRDPWGAAYSRFDPKWLLRLTEAHNGVLIDGKGHGYINGRQGTNASHAEAHIVRYMDRECWLALSSNATQAYKLVHPGLRSIVRTLVWIKPSWLLLLDQIRADEPVEVAARFFPNNEDGLARITVSAGGFTLERPRAIGYGFVSSNVGYQIKKGQLPLKKTEHDYIFVEPATERAKKIELVTVLELVSPGQRGPSRVEALQQGKSWQILLGGWSCQIWTTGLVPEVTCHRH